MDEALVELGFMLVILKLPVVYLCVVVWWAVKAEPPPDPARLAEPRREGGPPDRRSPRRPRPGPHGGPVRTYARKPARRRVTVEP